MRHLSTRRPHRVGALLKGPPHGDGVRPARISASIGPSMLPPVTIAPSRRPGALPSDFWSFSKPARAAAPDGSTRWWVQRMISRTASAHSSSLICTIRAAPATISSMATGCGHPGGDAVDERRHRVGVDGSTCFERQCGRGSALCDHSDDLGAEPEQIPNRDEPTDPRAQADRNIDRVELTRCAEQLVGVRGDTTTQLAIERGHSFEATLLGDHHRMLECGLEVDAVFDQLGTEAAHRRVLVGAVAVRHDDGDRHTCSPTGERKALAMIAAGCGDDTANGRPLACQSIDVDQSTADLERTRRCAVLVLEPHLGTDMRTEQRPGELWCRQHEAGNNAG